LSDIDFESISEAERRRINVIPAMIYHGVKSEEAVLMRMNAVPRSAAERLGEEFKASIDDTADRVGLHEARQFLKGLEASDWERMRPEAAYLSGSNYMTLWQLLSGEER
jgi:hypothetical protein